MASNKVRVTRKLGNGTYIHYSDTVENAAKDTIAITIIENVVKLFFTIVFGLIKLPFMLIGSLLKTNTRSRRRY